MALLLGIETSCDETAAAVVEDGRIVRSSIISTQIEIHRRFGGVVPELASRNHVLDVVPVVQEALLAAGIGAHELDAVAVTSGPGLVGALLVGVQFAKALAYGHDKPLLPVHHLAGHLHAVFLHRPDERPSAAPEFPHLALCVSGGHSAVYRVDRPGGGTGRVALLAQTRDDAAGEAFDKVARMLGLGYPGGPIVERLAVGGDPKAHRFTQPRFKDDSPLDFSFSGLKTAVLAIIQRSAALPEGEALADLLASFQAAAVEQLVDRTRSAARAAGVTHVQVAGGVACNTALRERLRQVLADEGLTLFVAAPRDCTDNAAMIAGAAFADLPSERPLRSRPSDRLLEVRPSWPL